MVGEPFERDFNVYEGRASTFVTCSHCLVLQAWLADNCGGWIYGEVIEDIKEHAESYRRPDLARLVVAAEKGWRWLRPARHASIGRPVPAAPRGLEARDVY